MWFKVDDQLHSHPKAIKAGNEAMGLWVRLGSWCSCHLTDGKVPSEVVAVFDPNGVAIARLEATGWALKEEDGWLLHDYLEYQPSRKSQESLSKKRSAARKQSVNKTKTKCRQVDDKDTNKNPTKGTGTGTGTNKKKEAPEKPPRRLGDARQVFDFWVTETGRVNPKFDAKRQARIRARFDEGFNVGELIEAIRNAKHDPFLMGANDKKKTYTEIHTLLRDAAQVERLRDLRPSTSPANEPAVPYHRPIKLNRSA